MFFDDSYKMKYALFMCGGLESSLKDVEKLEKIFSNFDITKKINCYPQDEIINFLKKVKLQTKRKTLIYIHYSGHAVKRGKNVNGNMYILSAWVNPNGSTSISSEIDKLLSTISCDVILSTDCCHSEAFGDHFTGKYPYIFIGTSLLGEISRSSIKEGGSLICTYEYLKNNNIDFTLDNIKKFHYELFKKQLIIKKINL